MSNELEEKLARRRRWEDNRPPPPPLPVVEPSGSSKGGAPARPAPTAPSIPARTYKAKLSRDGSGNLSSRSLDGSGSSQLTGGSVNDVGSVSSTGGATISSTKTTLLKALDAVANAPPSADQANVGMPFERPVLGKSGSNRHLAKQMEIISRTSPPVARVPQRTPPPVPTATNSRTSLPQRAAPPPPILMASAAETAATSSTSSPRPSRSAPTPPPHMEIKKPPTRSAPSPRPAAPSSPSIHSKAFDLNGPAPGSTSPTLGHRGPSAPPVPKFTTHQLSSKTLQAMEEMSHLRPLLIKFYIHYKKEKLPIIDKILAAYGMHGAIEGEEKLNEALRAEYGSDLRSVFLEAGEEAELLRHFQQVARRPAAVTTSSNLAPGTSPEAAAISIMNEVVDDSDGASKLTFARAIYKFEPQEEGDLGFEIGQIIEVTDSSKDWWVGSYKRPDQKEKKGMFPKNYVEEISESIVLSLKAAEESSKEKSFVGTRSGSTSPSSLTSSPTIMAAAHAAARSRKLSSGSSPESAPRSGSGRLAAAAAGEEPGTEDEYSPELVKDDIHVTHYFKTAFEMISSEFKYVTDLFLADKAFVGPLTDSVGKDRTESMMPCWGDILRVHERLLGMLMETLPDVRQLERDFGNNNALLMTMPGSATGKGGAAPIRRPSYVMENSDLLDSVAGASAPTLKAHAVKLDVLEDCYSRLLESGRFLSETQRRDRVEFISAWIVRQSDVFNKFAPFLKAANPFISNYHNAVETLESFAGEELALMQKLELNPLLKNLKLRDFLIKPVQRVCKYPLLYREMIKYAPDEDTKLAAIKAQSNLMTIADQVNTMMKLNESGNAKKLQAIKACIRPMSDLDAYELHNAILRREGDLTVVGFNGSSHAPELKTMSATAGVLQAKPKGTVRGLLFQDQFLLVEVNLKFITKAERLRISTGFHVKNWESMKVEKQDADGFSITLAHAADGPAKGATITWSFKSTAVARDGWVEALMEMSDLLDKVRERMSLARQQEAKTENQRASRRKSNGSIDWDKTKISGAPTMPSRRPGAQGGLFSLIDELKTVQSIKLDHVKKSIV